MITAIVFVLFGLMGLAGSVILMNRIAVKKETGHQRKITAIFLHRLPRNACDRGGPDICGRNPSIAVAGTPLPDHHFFPCLEWTRDFPKNPLAPPFDLILHSGGGDLYFSI